VFQNLIENAVNYSNPESSDAVVTVVTRTQDDNIIIEIADSGIGIPESEQSKLFARFYRASNAIKFAPNGSGLGLYIVKSIIQIFDGTINFSSVQNKGTTFTITFPIK
jgi:signal transduction histidine kinase